MTRRVRRFDRRAVELEVTFGPRLRQAAVEERHSFLAARACVCTQAEQGRGRVLEVHALAVDGHVFEQPVRIPLREFGVGEVGNLLAHLRLHLIGSEVEVAAHALHALVLELERGAFICGQPRIFQGSVDACLRGLEGAAAHQIHDRGHGAIVGDDGRNARSDDTCRYHHCQQRRQDACTQARGLHGCLSTGSGARICSR